MPDPNKEVLDYSERKAIVQIRQRQAAMLWWLNQREKHPLGMVPVPTAARMLGISRCRLHNLILAGRIKIVEGMPGGGRLDRFVPMTEIFTAPFRGNRGQPGLYGAKARRGKPKIRNTRGNPSTTPSMPVPA